MTGKDKATKTNRTIAGLALACLCVFSIFAVLVAFDSVNVTPDIFAAAVVFIFSIVIFSAVTIDLVNRIFTAIPIKSIFQIISISTSPILVRFIRPQPPIPLS